MSPAALTEAGFYDALERLAQEDSAVQNLLQEFGPPPFWTRPPGFATLVQIILEQQVSLASARAAFRRLLALGAPLTPALFLAHSDQALRSAGFSRQKTGYCRQVAAALLSGKFDLDALKTMEDQLALDALMALKGIGDWSAQVYLLMALRRPDAWPAGDVALQDSIQKTYALANRPDTREMIRLGSRWQPWRAAAARLFWHAYLSR